MELSEQEKQDARTIIEGFYGATATSSIRINRRVVAVIGEMLTSDRRCAELMDLVPRPAGTAAGVNYIRRQLRNIARRIISNDSGYLACRNIVAAASYRTRLHEASIFGD